MNQHIHVTMVLARKRVFETFISPGFYIVQCIGLVFCYFLITGFAGSVDSSGFNPTLNPLYDIIGRTLNGTFGLTFTLKLFAEGPFLLSLYVSFAPVMIYLALSSVFRFGFEKNVGAIELIVYGPADGTACFTALLLKDLFFIALNLLITTVLFWIASLTNNLSIGPSFYQALISLLFFSCAVFSYGLFCSIVTDNAASGIALFAGIFVFFAFVQLGTYSIISTYVRNFSTILSWIVKWASPLFYRSWGTSHLERGNEGVFALSLILLLLLSAILLYFAHSVLRSRGVRK